MPQDFAKKRNSKSKSSSKKKPARAATRTNDQASSHWSWYFSGLFSGILVCAVAYIVIAQLDSSPGLPEAISGSEPEEEESGTNLDFYDYLPQAEAENGGIEENPVTYFLQAGSFLDPNDAEELRARLILMNLDAIVQPTPLSGRTWYRVQAGPFIGRRSVESAENTLRENNIDPLRLRK